MSSKNIANSNCDYFTLENSTLDGGGTGLYLDGTGYVSLPKQKGGLIKGNTFRNQSKTAVYMTKEHDGIIENNRIIISGKAASFELKGIDAVMMGNTIIRGNRIYADNTAARLWQDATVCTTTKLSSTTSIMQKFTAYIYRTLSQIRT